MKVFNTLADLQAAPLKADSKQLVQTKGKLSIGDGLGETYYITTGTPDDESSFGLVNGNIAVIYVSGSLTTINHTRTITFDSVADLVADNAKANALQVGQRVGRYYYEKGDAGYAEGVVKTSTQATADGDVIEGYYNVNLANGNVWIGEVKNNTLFAVAFGLTSSNPDSHIELKALFDTGRNLIIDVPVTIGTAFSTASSDFTIECIAPIIINWESVGLTDAITFTGDNIDTKLVSQSSDETYVTDNVATLQLNSAFEFTGDNCSCIGGHTENHPIFVTSSGTDKKFTFKDNTGFSVIVGNIQEPFDIAMFHYEDGSRGVVTGNTGSNFGHGILFGQSSNNSVIDGNRFNDCGNHAIYVSSGDNNVVSNNQAEGLFTDIKVRGDNNVVVGNNVLGGVLSATNRVVDVGNGFAINSLNVTGNNIKCSRAGVRALNIRFRTDFDGAVRNINVTGNTVQADSSGLLEGLLVLFSSLSDVVVADNSVVGSASNQFTDGIKVSPTDGVTVTSNARTVVSSNVVAGCSEQGFQITGFNGAITNNVIECNGGSGSNAGGMLLFVGNFAVGNNNITVNDLNAPGINQKGDDNNTITSNVITTNVGTHVAQTGVANIVANNIQL